MNKLIEMNETIPSVIKDPFAKNKIEKILVCYHPNHNGGPWCWGKLSFKNGNTGGEQDFDGTSFDEVVAQMKAVIDTL